jgi:hypothetical protein
MQLSGVGNLPCGLVATVARWHHWRGICPFCGFLVSAAGRSLRVDESLYLLLQARWVIDTDRVLTASGWEELARRVRYPRLVMRRRSAGGYRRSAARGETRQVSCSA